MTLDPANPGSLALVRELLGELLPMFTSRRVQHRSRRDVGAAARAARRVLRVDRDAARASRARRPRGDHLGRHVLGRRRRSSRKVPAGVTVCEWGYDAGVSVRRAHRAARRRRHPVLGRARHVELAQHRRARHQRGRELPGRGARPRSPTAESASSTPTGATAATCSSCRSAIRASRTAPRCRGASTPTPTSISAPR